MTAFARTAAALLVVAAILSGPVAAQAPAGFFGSWHMDLARSDFGGPAPYARGRWKIERAPDDQVTMIYDLVGTRGGVTHMEWTGRFDGADYRLQGPDAVVTYAYVPVDDQNLNVVVKVDGRVTATSRLTISSGGTLTATTEAQTAAGTSRTVSTYERR